MSIDRSFRLPSGLVLPNRLIKASMSEGLADRAGAPDARLERLYGRWAAGGIGAMLTGNVMVDARYLERPGNVVVESDAALAALRRWAAAGQAQGGRMIAQICHPGRQTNRFVSTEPLAPSDGPAVEMMGSFAPPRAMTNAEVEDAIARFARTAAVLERAGFDGVEIHAAHGYLASQFLSPRTNRRTDAWGGDAERRSRFLFEVIRAVRAATGGAFTVGVKLNSADFQRGGFDEGAALEVVRRLDGANVDFIEVSGGNYEAPVLLEGVEAPTVKASTAAREAYFLEFARAARAVTAVPLLVTGGFRSGGAMRRAIESGACDLVGVARPLAFEPDLPRRLLTDESARIDLPRFAVPRRIVALAEAAYYADQMARIGRGLEPTRSPSALVPILRFLVGDIFAARRWRRSLRASAVVAPSPVLA